MRFSSCFLVLIGSLVSLSAVALPTVEKGPLASILPNLQILFDGEHDLPVAVTVTEITGDGECQEPGSMCEQAALYVIIFDDQKLPVKSITYNLGKAHDWTLQVVSRCKGSEEDSCARVVVDQTVTDAVNKTWKIVRHAYEFRLDSVKEIEK